jgi:hypothetical protein
VVVRRGVWRLVEALLVTKTFSPMFFGLPNAMAALVLRKNGRKVEFQGWQLLNSKNTLRKLKLSVDSFTQTQLWIWNLALMPKSLRNQDRIHTLTLK